VSQTVTVGGSVTITAAATGVPAPTFNGRKMASPSTARPMPPWR
jgi:hypothetical protein